MSAAVGGARRLGAALVSLVPLALVGACAASGAAPDDRESVAPATPAPAACELRAHNIRYPTDACTACMQANCCEVTVACFSGDLECAALHECLIGCPADEDTVIVLGAGLSCKDKCEQTHAPAVAAHKSYDTCIRTVCEAPCDSGK